MNTSVMQSEKSQPVPAVAEKELWIAPEVDIYETQEAYVLHAEMPGVQKSGLEITVEDNELTLIGRRTTTAPKGEVVFRESREANFRRVFELDPAVDTERITARVDQGLLTLSLPKAEKVKPRRIAIEG
jgi:HSP20 family protein